MIPQYVSKLSTDLEPQAGDIVLAAGIQDVGGNRRQVATNVNQAVSSTSIAQIINSSGLNSTDVTFGYDSGGRATISFKIRWQH